MVLNESIQVFCNESFVKGFSNFDLGMEVVKLSKFGLLALVGGILLSFLVVGLIFGNWGSGRYWVYFVVMLLVGVLVVFVGYPYLLNM